MDRRAGGEPAPAISSPVPVPDPPRAPAPPPVPQRRGRRTALAAAAGGLGLAALLAGLAAVRDDPPPAPTAGGEDAAMAVHLQGAFDAVLPGWSVRSARLLHPVRGPWLATAVSPAGATVFYRVTLRRAGGGWSIAAQPSHPLPGLPP